MESHTVFESTIIGFFVGVIASTYIAFLDGAGRYLGNILDWISLRPILLTLEISRSLIVMFLLILAVYTFYGFIIAIIINNKPKTKLIIIPVIVLLLVAIFFEQKNGQAQTVAVSDITYSKIQILPKKVPSVIQQQYFGNEVVGDLNNDGKNDVAFILLRKDKDRGTLHYLSTALTTDNGHVGTNLIYLGEKIEPKNISIDHGIIGVTYVDHLDKKTKIAYARINDGNLELATVADNGDSLIWGEIRLDQEKETFKSCNNGDILWLMSSSSVLKIVNTWADDMASTSEASSTIIGAFVGKIVDAPLKIFEEGYKQAFSVKNIITLVPNSVCQ